MDMGWETILKRVHRTKVIMGEDSQASGCVEGSVPIVQLSDRQAVPIRRTSSGVSERLCRDSSSRVLPFISAAFRTPTRPLGRRRIHLQQITRPALGIIGTADAFVSIQSAVIQVPRSAQKARKRHH